MSKQLPKVSAAYLDDSGCRKATTDLFVIFPLDPR